MNNILHLTTIVDAYDHPRRYLEDELIILDVMLEFEIERIQARQELAAEFSHQYQGMYFSENEARLLLNANAPYLTLDEEQLLLLEHLRRRIAARIERSFQEGIVLPVHYLRNHMGLADVEIHALIAAIAPHMDRKYLKLYGYVQDDMTCQYVTLDLLLHLCCINDEERTHLRESITNSNSILGSFFNSRIHTGSTSEATILTEPLHLEPRIIQYLIGMEWRYSGALASLQRYDLSEALPPLLLQEHIQGSIIRYMHDEAAQGTAWLIAMQGVPGSGRTLQARYICRSLKRSLLEWDVTCAPEELAAFQSAVEQFLLEASLWDAIPAFDQLHKLDDRANETSKPDYRLQWLMERLARSHGAVFLFSEHRIAQPVLSAQVHWIFIAIPQPDLEQSSRLWMELAASWRTLTEEDAHQLAGKFRFTPGRIASAVETARQLEGWTAIEIAMNESAAPTIGQLLHQSAYRIISHGLEQKAVKVEPKFGWDDLILPDETIYLLRQACNRVKDRHRVMHQWGFDRVLPYGRGVSMMFTGPPGTGKTMSALVMAKEMEAELYRVDLSRIVSKYIGETEKNLSDIFDHARLSGAILFFDEADALFGKRSEVKDSHDKYANMETSYLLQKMEEYDGLTILATNFSQNMDDAFTRRIQFIVKYPFPDAAQREQLWRTSIPAQVPTEQMDYKFLSETFELSGGPIKNIILTAAYLAANEGSILTMKHMVEGAIQEYKKTGKLLLKDRLGPYAGYWKG